MGVTNIDEKREQNSCGAGFELEILTRFRIIRGPPEKQNQRNVYIEKGRFT